LLTRKKMEKMEGMRREDERKSTDAPTLLPTYLLTEKRSRIERQFPSRFFRCSGRPI